VGIGFTSSLISSKVPKNQLKRRLELSTSESPKVPLVRKYNVASTIKKRIKISIVSFLYLVYRMKFPKLPKNKWVIALTLLVVFVVGLYGIQYLQSKWMMESFAGNGVCDRVFEKPTFVLYYASWCPHCKKMMPAWDKFASEWKSSKVVVEKVDLAEDENACLKDKWSIESYPTILLHKPKVDKPVEYPKSNEREAGAFASWLKEKSA